jgi:hypothetical protein
VILCYCASGPSKPSHNPAKIALATGYADCGAGLRLGGSAAFAIISPALRTKRSSSLIDGGCGIDDGGLRVSAGSPDECFSFFFSTMNGFPVDSS